MRIALFTLILGLMLTTASRAAELRVAVASNFQGTLEQLAPLYEKDSGNTLLVSAGSTGALFAQIENGAPFDVFFAADARRPRALVDDSLALPASVFTYARGVPVLWSANPDLITDGGNTLRQADYEYLALAHPRNAPYGVAARQVLESLGLWTRLDEEQRLLRGRNIGQTYSQVASGAAPLGFVALSQIRHPDVRGKGSWWIPPEDSYEPIIQQAVILQSSRNRELAEEFMHFVRSPAAAEIIRAAGYTIDEGQ